jgi:hypothetical protein
MGTADGQVKNATKLVNNGPDGERWNVILLGDGFTKDEQDKFVTAATAFKDALHATPPFTEAAVWNRLNVHRVEVWSNESGADNPPTCEDNTTPVGGTPTTAATYFDASFCHRGLRRMLEVDPALVLNAAITRVPTASHRVAVVIVNHLEHGGTGGQVGCYSLAPGAVEIAIHELGHTAFGLADEYAYERGCDSKEVGHDSYRGDEPRQPNVTMNADRATLKWRHLVDKSTDLSSPTLTNLDCTKCPSRPNPVSDDTIGLFEGARYFHCALYRPAFNCKMRELFQPFCAVCKDAIRRKLAVMTPPSKC